MGVNVHGTKDAKLVGYCPRARRLASIFRGPNCWKKSQSVSHIVSFIANPPRPRSRPTRPSRRTVSNRTVPLPSVNTRKKRPSKENRQHASATGTVIYGSSARTPRHRRPRWALGRHPAQYLLSSSRPRRAVRRRAPRHGRPLDDESDLGWAVTRHPSCVTRLASSHLPAWSAVHSR